MDNNRQSIINSISESIRNNNISLNRIFTKPLKVKDGKVYISWAEGVDIEYSKIISSVREITTVTNAISDTTIKDLPTNIITLFNNTKLLLNNNINTFTYTPYITTNNFLTKNGNYVISKISNTVVDNMAIGISSKSSVVDDVLSYNEESTLSIYQSKQELPGVSTGLLNEINDIDDQYTVSFEMRLNHFPRKTHKVKNTKYDSNPNTTKKYTSRRTDIISFNYDSENINNKIEFGAMAPFGIKSETFNNIRLYDNNFDNFSIAACLTYDDSKKLSIYTDYKFKLGQTYNIKLSIRRITDEYIDELDRVVNINKEVGGNFIIFDGIKMLTEEVQKKKENISQIKYELDRFRSIRQNYFYKFDEIKTDVDKRNFDGEKITSFRFAKKDYSYNSNVEKQAVLDIISDIKKYNDNINTFGNPAAYDIKLEVNGFLEDVSTYDGKVWGNKAKKQKVKRLIATQPGFIPATDLQMAVDRSQLNDTYLGNTSFKIVIDDFMISGQSLREITKANPEFNIFIKNDYKYIIREVLFNMISMDRAFKDDNEMFDYIQQYILNSKEQTKYPLYDNLPNLIINQKKLNKLGFVTRIVYNSDMRFPFRSDSSSKLEVLQKVLKLRRPGLYKLVFGNVTNFSIKDFTSDQVIINEQDETFITRDGGKLSGPNSLYILNNYSWDECFKKNLRGVDYKSLKDTHDNIGDQIKNIEFILYDDNNDKFYKLKFKYWSSNGGFSGFFQEIKTKPYDILEDSNKNHNKFGPNILYTPIYYDERAVYIKYKDNPFLHIDKQNGRYPEIKKNQLNYEIYNSVTKFFKKFDVTKLRSIDTVPYKINTKNQISGIFNTISILTNDLPSSDLAVLNPGEIIQAPIEVGPIKIGGDKETVVEDLQKTIDIYKKESSLYFDEIKKRKKYQLNLPQILKNIKRFDKLYGKYNYKLNSSIDFGSINIYYTKIKDQITLLNSEIEITNTNSSTNVIQIESISSEVKGSALNPVVELNIYPELPPGLKLTNDGNIEGNTTLVTSSEYTISAVIYNKEYITNKKYQVIISTIKVEEA